MLLDNFTVVIVFYKDGGLGVVLSLIDYCCSCRNPACGISKLRDSCHSMQSRFRTHDIVSAASMPVTFSCPRRLESPITSAWHALAVSLKTSLNCDDCQSSLGGLARRETLFQPPSFLVLLTRLQTRQD